MAYGTQPLPPASNRDSEGDGAGVRLGRGESLLELHVVGASLSGAALRVLGDAQPTTFCTYAVYDFETHATPLGHGARPRYGFTSRYILRAEPLLLHYLQGSAARLDLHVAVGTEHRALAICHLRLAEALATTQRVHATAALQGESCSLLIEPMLSLPGEPHNKAPLMSAFPRPSSGPPTTFPCTQVRAARTTGCWSTGCGCAHPCSRACGCSRNAPKLWAICQPV